jgi:hypothetical protein
MEMSCGLLERCYVQRVDDARNIAQNRQEDVDEEVCAAATLEEDSERWEEDGEDDLDDVAVVIVSMTL